MWYMVLYLKRGTQIYNNFYDGDPQNGTMILGNSHMPPLPVQDAYLSLPAAEGAGTSFEGVEARLGNIYIYGWLSKFWSLFGSLL